MGDGPQIPNRAVRWVAWGWWCKSWAARLRVIGGFCPAQEFDACTPHSLGYVRRAMVEPGLVTLAKIVGTLLLAMGVVPFLFLLSPGDRTEPEPKDTFDGDVQ